MSRLEHDTIKKGQVGNALSEPAKDWDFEVGNNKKYDVETIIDSLVYGYQANNQMPDLYYLILWKSYLKEKNIWELLLAVIHFRKLISIFYIEYLEKLTAISLSLESALLIAKASSSKKLKQKRSHPSKGANNNDRKYGITLKPMKAVVLFVAPDVQRCLS